MQGAADTAIVKLVPSKLDVGTAKTQTTLAALICVAAAAVSFLPAVHLGFIGSDFPVLHTVAALTEGGPGGFAAALNNKEIIESGYGPLAVAFYALDYLLFGVQSAAYHIVNSLLFAGAAVFTAATAWRLGDLQASRLAAVIFAWAALIYCVYPAHADSVAWIGGQPDLLCQLLIASSIFCYLQFRTFRERGYLAISMVAFVLALFVEAHAIMVPAVVLAAELFLFNGEKVPAVRRATFVASYWMVLFFFTSLALASPWPLPFSPANKPLADLFLPLISAETWQRLFVFPSSLPVTGAANANALLSWVLLAGYAASLVMLVVRASQRTVRWQPLAFVVAWLVLSLIGEQLAAEAVGRALLSASAPLCILLTLLSVPAIDVIGRLWVGRLSMAGTIPLVMIFGSYTCYMEQNMADWQAAAADTQALRLAVESISQRLPKGAGILITALPVSLPGNWSHDAFAEPFMSLGRIVETVSPQIIQSKFLWNQKLVTLVADTKSGALVRWDNQSGPLIAWAKPSGADHFSFDFDKSDDHVDGGKKGASLWLPPEELNPQRLDVAELVMRTSDPAAIEGKVRLLWEATAGESGKRQTGSAGIWQRSGDRYLVWVGRYPNWTLNRTVQRLGLQFPAGNFSIDLKSLKLVPHVVAMPDLKLESAGTLFEPRPQPPQLRRSDGATLHFNVSRVAGAAGIRLWVWDEHAGFDADSEQQLYDFGATNAARPVFRSDFMTVSDAVTLAPEIFNSAGAYQARAVALDKNRAPIGLPTEPLEFCFKK